MKKLIFFVVFALLSSASLAAAQVPSTSNRIPVQVGVVLKTDPNYSDKNFKNPEALQRLATGFLLETHPEFQLRNYDKSVWTGIKLKISAERVSFRPPPGSDGQIIAANIEQYGQAICNNVYGKIGRIACAASDGARRYLISRAPRYVSTWRYRLDVLPSIWDDDQKKWVEPSFGLSSGAFDVPYDVIYWTDNHTSGQVVLFHGTNVEVGETWMDEGASILLKRYFSDPSHLQQPQILKPLREAIEIQRRGKR